MFISHRGSKLCCVNSLTSKEKPKQFWDGEIRKNAKQNMQKNIDVSGCQICYNKEKNKILSNRNLYNSEKNFTIKTLPTKLDLDFSNLCNLKCIMCNSSRSSQWAKDEKLHLLTNGVVSISKNNIDDICFISKDLEHLTLQGGEPTLIPEFLYYFDYLKKNKIIQNINLQLITNLTNLNAKFFNFLKYFKSVKVSVSIDAYGQVNDFIRFPSNFEQLEKNLINLCDNFENVQVEILNSIQILTFFNYDEFLKWCKYLEEIFIAKKKNFKVVAMKVIDPLIYNLFNAPDKLKGKFVNDVDDFFKKNPNSLKGNQNFQIELLLLKKNLLKFKSNEDILKNFLKKIELTCKERNLIITDKINNFYDYF